MTPSSSRAHARRPAAAAILAGLALLVTGCTGGAREPSPPAEVLDLYAATYGALPGTDGVAEANVASDPEPDEAPGAALDAGTPDTAPAPAPGEVASISPEPPEPEAPEPEAASAATAVEPEPPEIDATPSDLFGLDEAGIAALLGPPHFTRNEAPARVLQYAGQSCVLDLFLYPEGPEETLRTVYFEIRPLSDTPVGAGCFSGLVLAARNF